MSPKGLTTSAIPYNGSAFDIEFNFIDHKLDIRSSAGNSKTFDFKPMTVAEFYGKITSALNEMEIKVSILARPVEVVEAIPFADDTQHKSYDSDAVTRFSGRSAPKHPGGAPNGADWVMEEAYSHELSSAGFWPGIGLGEPALYSYAYYEPDGFKESEIHPEEAT